MSNILPGLITMKPADYNKLYETAIDAKELVDSIEQSNLLLELSDMISAIEAVAYNLRVVLPSLLVMNEATKKAFKDGSRNSSGKYRGDLGCMKTTFNNSSEKYLLVSI